MREPMNVLKQFDEENGPSVAIGGWFYFANGAKREVNPMGRLVEPPDDPYSLAKIQFLYHEALLKRATDAFYELKEKVLSLAGANQHNGFAIMPDDEIPKLKKLKLLVLQRQKNFRKAEEQVKATMPKHIRNRRDARADADEAYEKFMRKMNNLKV